MIRKQAYHVAHDNPILARVRQFHEAKKSDPYIIFVENKNTSNTQVVLFDAQNNLGTQGNNLPVGISVNTKFNYTTGQQLTTAFNTGTGTFNGGTTASFAGKTASYDIGGLTPAQASEQFQINADFSINALLTRDGASARITYEFATSDESLTNITIGAQTFALTRSDSAFFAYAGAASTYDEFLQQIAVRPMFMEGNFVDSTKIAVIQSNDFIVERADVTGESVKTFMVLNLDPYMRASQRTMPNFNILDGQTSLTLTIGGRSRQSFYLYALEEMDKSELLDAGSVPENMDEDKIEDPIEKPTRPFDDYQMPTDSFSSF